MASVLLVAMGIAFLIGFAYELFAQNTDKVPFSIQEDLIETKLPIVWVLLAVGLGLIVLGM